MAGLSGFLKRNCRNCTVTETKKAPPKPVFRDGYKLTWVLRDDEYYIGIDFDNTSEDPNLDISYHAGIYRHGSLRVPKQHLMEFACAVAEIAQKVEDRDD